MKGRHVAAHLQNLIVFPVVNLPKNTLTLSFVQS